MSCHVMSICYCLFTVFISYRQHFTYWAHEKETKDLPSDDQSQSSPSDQSPETVVEMAKLGGSKEPQRESEQGNCS